MDNNEYIKNTINEYHQYAEINNQKDYIPEICNEIAGEENIVFSLIYSF